MGIDNSVRLIGHLGKDPEKAATTSGVLVATLNMATNSHFTDKDGERQTVTDWHRVVFFGRGAENALSLLKKGSHLVVEGRLKTRKWTDGNGVDRWVTEVIAEEFRLLDKKESDAADHKSDTTHNPEKQSTAKSKDKEMEEPIPPDNDIPF